MEPSTVQINYRFDRQREANAEGDRPVMFTIDINGGPAAMALKFVLTGPQADKFAGDLLNVLSGGIEVARQMPGGTG